MKSLPQLFSPLKIRELTLKNRIVVSPMCQYSAEDGVPNDWHLVHLGSRAVGGAAVVIAEATAVSPEGRISPNDLGIWNQDQVAAFKKITKFIKQQNSIAGIQIAHAGRKGSTPVPWAAQAPLDSKNGAWTPVAPSAIAFSPTYPNPKELTSTEINSIVEQFTVAAKNALEAGFELVEIHMAHGYLLNEFLSPLTNKRTDEYGGSIENRMRLPLIIAEKIRGLWPQKWPVLVRISATDWADGGWTLEDSIQFSKKLKGIGIDLMDCSSGGSIADAKIKTGPGYQVEFSHGIRQATGMLTGAVGMITSPEQAERILNEGQADIVLLARELLRDPYWPLHAAKALNADIEWPKQYDRAKIK